MYWTNMEIQPWAKESHVHGLIDVKVYKGETKMHQNNHIIMVSVQHDKKGPR